MQQLTSDVVAVSPDGLHDRPAARVRPSYMLVRHPLRTRPRVAVPGRGRPLPEVIGRDVLRHPRSRVPAKSFPCRYRDAPFGKCQPMSLTDGIECSRFFTLAAVWSACGGPPRATGCCADLWIRWERRREGPSFPLLPSLPRSFLRFVFLPYASLVRFPTGTRPRPLARRRVDRRGRTRWQRVKLVSRNGRRRETNFSRSSAAR